MKVFLGIVMLIIIAVVTKFVIPRFSTPPCAPPAGMECASLEHLRHIGREISATLPKDLSSEVRLMRVWARDSEVVYDVRLINYSSREIDRAKFEKGAFDHMRKEFCGDPKMKAFKAYGVVATFQATGNDGINVGTITVGLSDC